MKTPESSIENQIAQLPHRERARLALALIERLDPGAATTSDGVSPASAFADSHFHTRFRSRTSTTVVDDFTADPLGGWGNFG